MAKKDAAQFVVNVVKRALSSDAEKALPPKGGLSAVRNLSRSADEEMEAKRLAREMASPPIKASEAYGQHEGSYLKPIFYDRMKVDLSKGKLGGPGFSGIQLVDPNYANAKAVAGVTDQKMATRILNRNKAQVPEGAKVIWTPSVGGLEQHKSNSTMFGQFADIFASQRKNMSAEEIQKLSDRASNMTDNNGRLIFPSGIDLGARNFRQQVKTYDQRSLMADIFAGRGVGGEKGRTVPVEELLEKNLDPNMANAGTLDLGNRLFRLEGDVIDRPDLHSDYRKILTGEDLDVNYLPVPIRDVYSDWEIQKALELEAQNKKRPVTLMDYTKNDPTVQLTEELLTKMQKAGHKDGGAIQDDDQELRAMIADHLDNQAHDQELRAMVDNHLAGGGAPEPVNQGFKKLEFMAGGGVIHMAGGGKMGRGIAKGVKSIFGGADKIAPAIQGGTRRFGEQAGGNTIMKETGGNWLTGSVEKGLQPLRRRTAGGDDPISAIEKLNKSFPDATNRPGYVDANIGRLQQDVALNKWVDSNLTNYVKKQMGTADDTVRKLAEEGIVHIPSKQVGVNRYRAPQKRKELGQPQLGQSDAAKAWEDASDVAVNTPTAKAIKENESLYQANPWIDKLSNEERVYALNQPASSNSEVSGLGFDHIMDVLRQDVAAGRIRPEQLNKVSITDAVRRTHEFDQEMARRMAEAQIKNTAGMPTHKEYPDQGFKWIQLSQPEELPKGWSKEASGAYVGPNGERTIVNPSRQTLEDSLKYEGDTMDHCVGSYCDDVAEGNSQIYSLRDAKGEPHVTIEVYPPSIDDYSAANQSTPYKPAQPRIVQIKGKGNAKPKEEYLPFVQDFVKSGEWSQVGDLNNTGLIYRDGKYLTPAEDSDLLLKELGIPPEGMAEGGGAFKKIQWAKPQHFDGGGIASPEEQSIGYSSEPSEMYKEVKQTLSDDYDRLKSSARARAQYAKILAAQAAGGGPDLAHLGVDLVLDPLKSVTIDKLLTKPRPRSVLEGPYNPNSPVKSEHERVPMFGSISDALKTEDGLPIGGSEHMIKRAQEAGLMYGKPINVLDESGYPVVDPQTGEPYESRSGRFSPITEIGGAVLGGLGLSKLGKLAKKGYVKNLEPRIDPAGSLSRAITDDSNNFINSYAKNPAGLGGLGSMSKLAKPLAKAAKKLPKDIPVGLSIKAVGDIPTGAPKLKVRPPSDNVANVRDANFQYPKTVGNQTVDINKLSGGVRMSDPKEVKRVKALADQMSGPEGYISRIIVDHNNNVIEGQHRLEALRQLGVKDVPVFKIEDLADTMPVSKMEEAMREAGGIHSDHVNQLMQHALDHISEGGIEGARQLDYGKFQKHYDAALDAVSGMRPVLPAAEREANLAKMLEGSQIKQRLYHGTGDDIKEFRNSRIGAMGPGTYLAESPQNASAYSTITNRKGSANQANVMPVYVQIKNPFVISDVNNSSEELFKYFDPTGKLSDDEVIKKVLDAGYDSIYAKGTGEINVLDPRRIKSATGNRGTYDITEPDISKARGGAILKHRTLRNRMVNQRVR